MKKIISIGLVVVVVLSLGAMAFADEIDETFQRGFGRNHMATEDRLQVNEARNLNLSLNFEEKSAEYLAELTDLSEEEILASDKSIHALAEEEGVLDELQAFVLKEKEDLLTDLVEEGTISQEKADFMLERMSLMDGSQQRLGRSVEKVQGRSFGRGSGDCFNR